MATQYFTSPPTDSLYKFLAILGLALAFFSYTYSADLATDYRLKVIDLQSEQAKLKIQIKDLDERINSARRLQADDSLERKAIDDLGKELIERLIKDADITANFHKAEIALEQYEQFKKLSFWGLYAGLLMATLGFFLWYFKVQRHADRTAAKP